MGWIDRVFVHMLVRDGQGRLHFLPWGLFGLLLPFTRTFELADEGAERRVRRFLSAYLVVQVALIGLWLATGLLMLPGGGLWWALACLSPAPVFYLLGLRRLAADLPPTRLDGDLRLRLRLMAFAQPAALIWLNFLASLAGFCLGVWVAALDGGIVSRLVGSALALLCLLLAIYQISLIKIRAEAARG